MYAIEAKGLTKYFYKDKGVLELLKHPIRKVRITALNNVEIKVKYGELYGLLGLNGAGKTTLLKILSTMFIPDSGQAHVDGIDIMKNPDDVKSSIGLVYGEERSFNWRLTGRQNLEFFASLYNISHKGMKDYIDYLLKIVGLKDKADFRFDSYSTGMKHRLAIARGLLGNPKILLMDEPTLGVDPIGKEAIQNLIIDLVKKEGKTVLLVTHDLEEAKKVCDRVAIIDKGRILTEIDNAKGKDLGMIFKRVIKG